MSDQFKGLHELCLSLASQDIKQRLELLCKHFLGAGFGPWQSGSSLDSLDDFNYQLNTLDCVTFVEVVLALAKTRPLKELQNFKAEFESILRALHYKNAEPSFRARNHFTCCDWIPNNKFMLEDITKSIGPIYKTAHTVIDKPTWFARQQLVANISAANTANLAAVDSNIPYIESIQYLDNLSLYFDVFPEYSIVCIVRPDWDITERIGTHLNISHLGFVFKDHAAQDLIFYHATIDKKMVVQETLPGYIRRFLDTPSIRGFDVLAISPGYQNAG